MKQAVIKKILIHLTDELRQLTVAADAAHYAAIDEQSIAETQYDTLAIEAGYLAAGQSLRVQQLKDGLMAMKNLPEHSSAVIGLGSLVQLAQQQVSSQWLFVAPAAAGFSCMIASKKITVITPASPMGKALMNREIDDEVQIVLGAQTIIDEIVNIQ